MKKILSFVLLAASLQASMPTESQAGLILGAAIGGNAGGNVASVFVGGGVLSMLVGYAVGCDRSETHVRMVPVYEMRRDRYGRMVRVRVGTRREETTTCVVWNGNSTATTLLWAGLGAVILDNEVNAKGDALDAALTEKLSFLESDSLKSLAKTIRTAAAPVFAAGHDTAIVSLTEAQTREALSEAVLTDEELQTTIDLMK